MTSNAILKRARHRRLVNAAMDAYLDWRDECASVSSAYRCWADAGEADAAEAWLAYEIALDREEGASARYATAVRDADRCGAREDQSGMDLIAFGDALG
jgi:hypothetical protein